jgi:hypothetical protein
MLFGFIDCVERGKNSLPQHLAGAFDSNLGKSLVFDNKNFT